MSKDVSEKVSLELTLLAALDSIHAEVDISKIAEIQDWSRAVRGKFYGAAVKDASDLSKLKASLPSALRHPNAANAPVSPSEGVSRVPLGSSSMASYGSARYSKMAIPQLIAVCTSEPSAEAWHEFIRRFQPLIAGAITRVVHRFGKVSHELVDDLIQDVFLKLCKDNFRALRSVATAYDKSVLFRFLKVIAANTAQDYFRNAASARRGAGEALEADLVFMEHGSSRSAFSEIEREILFREIDKELKTREHEPNFGRDYAIFWLYYSQGLSAKEIAALPDINLGIKGVESTLLRLTRQIRVALTQKGENAAE